MALWKTNLRSLVYGLKNSRSVFHFFRKMVRFFAFTFFSEIEKIFRKPRNKSNSAIYIHLNQAKMEEARFGGWALTETALYAFVNAIPNLQEGVIEFGGGQSTIFFNVCSRKNPNLRVCTWENDMSWYSNLKSKITAPQIIINRRDIRAVSNKEFDELFISPKTAHSKFSDMGILMTDDSYSTSQIGDLITFYDLSDTDFDELRNFKHVILDGPHGEGRSLAFCLLYQCLQPGTILLIDDYKGFGAMKNLTKLYSFEVIDKSMLFAKSWIVVRITGKTAGQLQGR